jgi:hypothetical protein
VLGADAVGRPDRLQRRARRAGRVDGLIAARVERRDDRVADEAVDLAALGPDWRGSRASNAVFSIEETSRGSRPSENDVNPDRSANITLTSRLPALVSSR